MRAFLAVLAAWLLSATLASAQMMGISGGPFTVSGAAYSGPGDKVSGAAAFYSCTRSYSAAYATGSNKACNLRRASDNTTLDVNILSNGNFDSASAVAFAPADATLSCTSLTTTLTCTGASSTPHVSSTVTGAGYSIPCIITGVGTFTGGAGTLTTNGCGTVSVAVSVTAKYGLFVTEMYDQTGSTNNVTQATAGSQPQWLPNCGNGFPCMYSNGVTGYLSLSSGSGRGAQPYSASVVAERTGSFTSFVDLNGDPNIQWGWSNAANSAALTSGGSTQTTTASDSVVHSMQYVFTGASSSITVDGANSGSKNPGTAAAQYPTFIGDTVSGGVHPMNGYIFEFGWWPTLAFNATQYGNLHTNASAYYGTP